jgi:uncharacterized protein YqkB
MKKILLALTAILISGATFAQKDLITSFFEKYSGHEGITVINVSGDMLKLITDAEQERRDTVFSSKLSEVKVMALEKNCDNPVSIDFRSEVYDKLDKSVYKEMMSVKQNEEDVFILVRESGNRISEILIIVGGQKENALIQVKGDLLLSELADMAGKYQMKGLEQLRQLEK